MFQRNEHSFTLSEMRRLQRARVAICGVGGGGCAVSEILTRTGVGFLRLIDGDIFEESNLNRQIGSTHETLGEHKTDVMKERLQSISRTLTAESVPMFINEENAERLLSDVDIVCDTVDGMENKLMLGRLCKRYGKPYATGGVGDTHAWTALLINKSTDDCFQKKGKRLKRFANPATVFLQASLQAQEIINFICGRDWNAFDKKISINHNTYSMNVTDL